MSSAGAPPAAFRRVLPEGPSLSATEAASTVRSEAAVVGERPHVALNMVSTADGRATVEGRTGSIGNQADRELFHALRAEADAVLVGAGTARVEHYGRVVRDPEARARRVRDGLPSEPLACLVSGRLDLPADDIPLLREPDADVVVLTASDAEVGGATARMHYLRAEAGVLDLRAMLVDLRTRFGIEFVLCEGGPTLNAALLAQGLVDELFLSLAPKLASGPAPLTIVEGDRLATPVEMKLTWLLECDDHLFLRYRLEQ